jgi:hypothetical protein
VDSNYQFPRRAASAGWCIEHRLVDGLRSFAISTSRVSENSDPQPSPSPPFSNAVIVCCCYHPLLPEARICGI